jgi:DNA-binding response OmpR family regulator
MGDSVAGRDDAPLVLVVEDGPYIGAMVKAALEDEGYRVHLEATGRAGIAAARERPPAVVILDLMLPDLDGQDVLRALKEDPATTAVPVIVMSAVASVLKPEERLLVEAVVRKPFELDDLLSAVQRATTP